MKAVLPFFFGLLFVGIAILGSVAFVATGQWFGAVFFSGGFLVGAVAWFAAAAQARGMKLGSLSEAWRAVFGRASEPD
jgi:hypothetical protein